MTAIRPSLAFGFLPRPDTTGSIMSARVDAISISVIWVSNPAGVTPIPAECERKSPEVAMVEINSGSPIHDALGARLSRLSEFKSIMETCVQLHAHSRRGS